MAESAVKITANWLGKIVLEEGKYLWGAEDKVVELRDELLWMQRFLKKAESFENKDEIVDQWVLQIKGYVSVADDIVDNFLIDVVSVRRQIGWRKKLKRWFCIGKELWALHQVASSIDSLTLKISKLTPKLTTYGVQPADGFKNNWIKETLKLEVEGQRMQFPRLAEHKKIIGLEKDTEELVGELVKPGSERRSVAIYGMGGLGKTTLATKVYNHHTVESHFTYRAWASISKKFRYENVLQTLLADLTSKSTSTFSGKDFETMIKELGEYLERNRCLVVLDDVWEAAVWDTLEHAFPRQGCKSGSKVVLTTRKQDVAQHADPLALAKPDPLQDNDSWELLKHSLGWLDEGSMNSTLWDDGAVRPDTLGKEMVKNCDGMPLAIVVLGGILRKKDSLEGWRLVSRNISPYLRRGSDHGRSYMEVFDLSYTDLPYHLKPCFLQLSNFPENYEIQAGRLCRMWVAEGLITWPFDRLSSTETLEDIANEYLSQLAQASMVQIIEKASNGRIKSIRIHDLIRDMCMQKAATEDFFTMIDHRSCADEPQILCSSSNHARLHHMAVYLDKECDDFLPDFLSSKAHEYLRTMVLFEGQTVSEGNVRKWMKRICNDFPWLRILDVEGLRLGGRLTKDVQKLKHLRYLSFKSTNLSELPSSIGKLVYLQTLDLRMSFSATPLKIPNILWKLERLRHLFLPKSSYEIKESKFLSLHTLRFLEILKNLEVRVLKPQDLKEIRRLRKLSIKEFVSDVKTVEIIVDSPAVKSGHLRSCSLCVEGGVIEAGSKILSRLDCLHKLKVKGNISCQQMIVLPQSLAEIHIESCELSDELIGILGNLRRLKHLSLGPNSYAEKTMTCKAKSFPQLISLNLQGLTNLENWNLDKESMTGLKKLVIMECGNMKKIPDALSQSVLVTCSPCITGINQRGTCNYYRPSFSSVVDRDVFIKRATATEDIAHLLTNTEYKIVILSGPAGIGKTTLANKIQYLPGIRKAFDDIAWVPCPDRRTPTPEHFIRKLLQKLDGVEKNNVRRKKTLIILHDYVAYRSDVFNKCTTGTTILLITDKLCADELQISDQRKVFEYILPPLSEEDSSKLFNSILSATLTGAEGVDKAKLGMELLKHCSKHPQSIVLLAGLLKMKKSLGEWQIIKSKLDDNAGKLNLCALCYADLPTALEDCFIYLANLTENRQVNVKKLYQLWIAAGLVRLKQSKRSNEGNDVVERLLENKAASYMNELVVREMVQVERSDLDGRISRYSIHTTLKNMCLQRAIEKGGIMMSVDVVESSSSTMNSGSRLPVLGSQRENHSSDPALKSLFFFRGAGTTGIPNTNDYNWRHFIDICSRFSQLQVLELSGMETIRGALPREVGKLTELKFLALRGTNVNSLPSEIQQLSLLQSLDLRVVPNLDIPSTPFTFPNMRHLYLPDFFTLSSSSSNTTSSKLQLVGFPGLQTLTNLNTQSVDLDCFSGLKTLRRVSVNHIYNVPEFASKFSSMPTPVELSFQGSIHPAVFFGDFEFLNKLTIKGRISRDSLNAITNLRCVKELKFKHTELEKDPMKVLRRLSGLTHLFLDHNSFLGKKITCSSGFPQLTHLTLRLLTNLEVLDMNEAHHLRHIKPVIIGCSRLIIKENTVYEIELGRLGLHPLMEQLDPKPPSPEAQPNVIFESTEMNAVSLENELPYPTRPESADEFQLLRYSTLPEKNLY